MRKGWSFNDPQGIEQCRDEGWLDKMKEQNTEGCRMSGKVKVNKVSNHCLREGVWADGIGDWEPTLQSWEIVPKQHEADPRTGQSSVVSERLQVLTK